MTDKGPIWYAEGHIAQSHHVPWTPDEDALLARGFIDQDLEGTTLHRWCAKRGLSRSAGAMDRRLVELCFFDSKVEKKHYPVGRGQERGEMTDKQRQARALLVAKANLANQIRLAKLEAKTGVALFKPKEL